MSQLLSNTSKTGVLSSNEVCRAMESVSDCILISTSGCIASKKAQYTMLLQKIINPIRLTCQKDISEVDDVYSTNTCTSSVGCLQAYSLSLVDNLCQEWEQINDCLQSVNEDCTILQEHIPGLLEYFCGVSDCDLHKVDECLPGSNDIQNGILANLKPDTISANKKPNSRVLDAINETLAARCNAIQLSQKCVHENLAGCSSLWKESYQSSLEFNIEAMRPFCAASGECRVHDCLQSSVWNVTKSLAMQDSDRLCMTISQTIQCIEDEAFWCPRETLHLYKKFVLEKLKPLSTSCDSGQGVLIESSCMDITSCMSNENDYCTEEFSECLDNICTVTSEVIKPVLSLLCKEQECRPDLASSCIAFLDPYISEKSLNEAVNILGEAISKRMEAFPGMIEIGQSLTKKAGAKADPRFCREVDAIATCIRRTTSTCGSFWKDYINEVFGESEVSAAENICSVCEMEETNMCLLSTLNNISALFYENGTTVNMCRVANQLFECINPESLVGCNHLQYSLFNILKRKLGGYSDSCPHCDQDFMNYGWPGIEDFLISSKDLYEVIELSNDADTYTELSCIFWSQLPKCQEEDKRNCSTILMMVEYVGELVCSNYPCDVESSTTCMQDLMEIHESDVPSGRCIPLENIPANGMFPAYPDVPGSGIIPDLQQAAFCQLSDMYLLQNLKNRVSPEILLEFLRHSGVLNDFLPSSIMRRMEEQGNNLTELERTKMLIEACRNADSAYTCLTDNLKSCSPIWLESIIGNYRVELESIKSVCRGQCKVDQVKNLMEFALYELALNSTVLSQDACSHIKNLEEALTLSTWLCPLDRKMIFSILLDQVIIPARQQCDEDVDGDQFSGCDSVELCMNNINVAVSSPYCNIIKQCGEEISSCPFAQTTLKPLLEFFCSYISDGQEEYCSISHANTCLGNLFNSKEYQLFRQQADFNRTCANIAGNQQSTCELEYTSHSDWLWAGFSTRSGNRPTEPGSGNRPTEPGSGNRPTEPGSGNRPTEPGSGNKPAEPGSGNRPTDPGNRPAELSSGSIRTETGSGNIPTEPGSGNRPTEPGSGNRPTEPGSGNRPAEPGAGNRPTEPGSGNRPTDPGNRPTELGSGNIPTETGSGNKPTEPASGNRPTESGSGNRPTEPGSGNRPTEPGSGNRPSVPGNNPTEECKRPLPYPKRNPFNPIKLCKLIKDFQTCLNETDNGCDSGWSYMLPSQALHYMNLEEFMQTCDDFGEESSESDRINGILTIDATLDKLLTSELVDYNLEPITSLMNGLYEMVVEALADFEEVLDVEVKDFQPSSNKKSTVASINVYMGVFLLRKEETKMGRYLRQQLIGRTMVLNDEIIQITRITLKTQTVGDAIDVSLDEVCSVYDTLGLCGKKGSCYEHDDQTPICLCQAGFEGTFCQYTKEEPLDLEAQDELGFTFTLKLPFYEKYKDMNNTETMEMVASLRNELSGMLSDHPGFGRVKIQRLFSGSLGLEPIVEFKHILDVQSANNVVQMFLEKLAINGDALIIEGQSVTLASAPKLLLTNDDGTNEIVALEDACSLLNARDSCKNGGQCEISGEGLPYCRCTGSWTGETCTLDYITILAIGVTILIVSTVICILVFCICCRKKKQ